MSISSYTDEHRAELEARRAVQVAQHAEYTKLIDDLFQGLVPKDGLPSTPEFAKMLASQARRYREAADRFHALDFAFRTIRGLVK